MMGFDAGADAIILVCLNFASLSVGPRSGVCGSQTNGGLSSGRVKVSRWSADFTKPFLIPSGRCGTFPDFPFLPSPT
jgi:hypothetical protein